MSHAELGRLQATKLYLERYGEPVAFYSDKQTVFHVNERSGVGGLMCPQGPVRNGCSTIVTGRKV